MAASTLKIGSYNILDQGEVAVSGNPDTGYIVSRLYDWSKNLLWKSSSGGDGYLFDGDGHIFDDDGFIDQGGSYTFLVTQPPGDIEDVDILFVSGHNFDGCTCSWQYSDDGESWSNAVDSWSQDGNDDITKTLTAANHKHWRLTVAKPPNPIMCGEIIMSGMYSFNVQAGPSPVHSYMDNVTWSRSVGGQERGIKLGDKGKAVAYTLRINASDLTNLQSVFTDLDGFSRPMLIKDKDDNYRLARFEPPPGEVYFHNDYTDINVTIQEML